VNEDNNNNILIDLFLEFGLKMFYCDKKAIREIGLNMILEIVDYSEDEEEKKYISKNLKMLIENKEIKFIEILFKDYQVDFIEKSYSIIKLIFNSNKLDNNSKENKKEIELIWRLFEKHKKDIDLDKVIIKLLHKIYDELYIGDSEFSEILLKIISNIKLDYEEPTNSLYLLKNKLARKSINNDEKRECCIYFTKKIFNDFSNSIQTDIKLLQEVSDFFPIFYNEIIEEFYQALKIEEKDNKEKKKSIENILIPLSSFQKILLNKKGEMPKLKDLKLMNEKDFIDLFKKNFSIYKELEIKKLDDIKSNKAQSEEEKEKKKEEELKKHKNNMEIFINFLINVIPILYPKEHYIDYLIDLSQSKLVEENDKQLFYDKIKLFIEEEKKDDKFKIGKEKEIFKIMMDKKNQENI
jgi:hypothetical protein